MMIGPTACGPNDVGSVVAFFRLPDNAVVELGTRVQI